jgi:hypothetical protein
MLSINHMLTAGILVLLVAFSPMSIGMYHGSTAPTLVSVPVAH